MEISMWLYICLFILYIWILLHLSLSPYEVEMSGRWFANYRQSETVKYDRCTRPADATLQTLVICGRKLFSRLLLNPKLILRGKMCSKVAVTLFTFIIYFSIDVTVRFSKFQSCYANRPSDLKQLCISILL